ncbi:MAG TPA: hypothetical protein ENN21_10070, partial [Spirochaetes bacterium]|nr:hypothetical protein [Spirochaetota bacterium]
MRGKSVFMIISWVLVITLVTAATGCGHGRKKPWYELNKMGDEILDQVLLCYMGEAWTGMTDIGE